MSTYSTILVAGPMQDGYILPQGTCAVTKVILGNVTTTQLVFALQDTNVHSIMLVNSSLLDVPTGATVTVENASNVSVRLINPVNPRLLDILVLVNGLSAGVYQYTNGNWLYRGAVQLVPFSNSIVSSKSVGVKSNLSFTGGVCKVTETSSIPHVMLPYTIYVDKQNNLVYFPYFTAATYQYPTAVTSVWSAVIAEALHQDMLVVVSPSGNKQTTSLPSGSEYTFITYTSLINASIHQPVAYHGNDKSVVTSALITPTQHQIDYSIIQGLSDTEYQLTGGYYKGGNNLWDRVISAQGTISTSQLLEVVPSSTYSSAMVDLQFSQFAPASNRTITVYIGSTTSINAGNIAYSLSLAMNHTNRIANIRLAAGESIHVKLNSPVQVNYRYSMLARTY